MQKFKVKAIVEEVWRTNHNPHYVKAIQLRNEYGLDFLSVTEIMHTWEYWSERVAAGWLQPSRGEVELAFGVELEEIQ